MTFNLHSGTVQSAVIWLQKHGQVRTVLHLHVRTARDLQSVWCVG
jgi:hypothetical protein